MSSSTTKRKVEVEEEELEKRIKTEPTSTSSSDNSSSSSTTTSASTSSVKSESSSSLSTPDEDDDSWYTSHPSSHLASYQRDSHGNIICPYLDTINRSYLDFDFEKLCSVSLSNMNVYCCLICGKYFQGRGKTSHAYAHSLDTEHHIYINLQNEMIFCLPDGYQIKDNSLKDIQYNLHPHFDQKLMNKLDAPGVHYSSALDGTGYIPGLVGLNNIKNTDWLNVIMQAFAQIKMLRNYFLLSDAWKFIKPLSQLTSSTSTTPATTSSTSSLTTSSSTSTLLLQSFGELLRKLWNPRAFKSHVSPHELLQAISSASNKQFKIGVHTDALKFLSWFLNNLHKDLGGSKKKNSSIIHQTFQGEIVVTTKKLNTTTDKDEDEEKKNTKNTEEKDAMETSTSTTSSSSSTTSNEQSTTINEVPFLYLSLALPTRPVFQDGSENRTIIPQVPLFEILKKFDGITPEINELDKTEKTYRIKKLPKYLILHYQRFYQNSFFWEKNPTLVTFPMQNLDMSPYVINYDKEHDQAKLREMLKPLSVAELKKRLDKHKVNYSGIVEKEELINLLQKASSKSDDSSSKRYDLLANIVHEGPAQAGSYRAHIHHRASNTWYEVQDLNVTTSETMAELVAISEAYIQIYELKQ